MFSSRRLVLCCALAFGPALAWADQPPGVVPNTAATAEAAPAKPNPSVALVADLAQDTLQELATAKLEAVHVLAGANDTRLERALQEALVTALFEKKVQLLDAPQKGGPSLRVVAFATPASDTERENMLQKGVSIVKNVLVADPRIGLVTRPFMRDNKKPVDATLLVTVSLVRDNHITTRKTTAYTLPGSEPLAQWGLANF